MLKKHDKKRNLFVSYMLLCILHKRGWIRHTVNYDRIHNPPKIVDSERSLFFNDTRFKFLVVIMYVGTTKLSYYLIVNTSVSMILFHCFWKPDQFVKSRGTPYINILIPFGGWKVASIWNRTPVMESYNLIQKIDAIAFRCAENNMSEMNKINRRIFFIPYHFILFYESFNDTACPTCVG